MNSLEDDFIYIHADTICDVPIIEELMKLKADINLPVEYKKCDEGAMKVKSIGGKIAEISKQIPNDMAEGEFIGIASFRKKHCIH